MKPKKRKYFVGTKKLKHVKMYESFINENKNIDVDDIIDRAKEQLLNEKIEPTDTIKITLMQIIKYKEQISRDSSLKKEDRSMFLKMLEVLENTLKYSNIK